MTGRLPTRQSGRRWSADKCDRIHDRLRENVAGQTDDPEDLLEVLIAAWDEMHAEAIPLRAEGDRLAQTARSQKGMLKVQGEEITRLRRQIRGAQGAIASCERTNGRLAKDLVDAWEFIWRVAGGAITGGGARQIARNYLLNRKTTEADRA